MTPQSIDDIGQPAAGGPVDRWADCAAVLECLAREVETEFDHADAAHVLQQAARELPGDTASTWQDRMKLAGALLGLQVSPAKATLREMMALVRRGAPVALWSARNPDDGSGWLVLTDRHGRRVLAAGLPAGSPSRWLSERRLAALLGSADRSSPVDFVLVHATTACAEASVTSVEHGGAAVANGHAAHGHMPPLRRLIRLMRPERRDFWTVIAFALMVGVLALATPLAVETLVSVVAFGGLMQPVVVLALLLFGCLAFGAAIKALQTYVVEIIQRRIFVRLVADLAHRLPRVRAEAFDRQHGPELVNRFFDVLTVQKTAAMLMLEGVAVLLSAAIGLLVLAFYHPILLAFDLVLLAGIAVIVFGVGRGAVATAIAESRAKYAVAGWLEEMARHPVSFKLAGGPVFALERADWLARQYLSTRQSHFRIVMAQVVSALGLQVAASTVLLVLGGWLVINGQLTLGQLVASELIVTVIVASFAKLGKHMENFYDLLAAVDKVGHLLDLPLEPAAGEALERTDRGMAVRLTDVSFAYDPRRPVFKGFSLELAPGERVAVSGPNGSGKSTLVDLLYGMRVPTAGRIEMDGLDVRDIRLDSLRHHVATVKGFEIIDATVIDNVRLGREHISLRQVRESLESVGLLEEVLSLPDGLSTRLTAGGAPLSYGQARRLMLARAIVAEPRLLVLDDMTDGLDKASRAAVLHVLFDEASPWTLVLITRSPELIDRCDRQVVLSPPSAGRPAGAAAIQTAGAALPSDAIGEAQR